MCIEALVFIKFRKSIDNFITSRQTNNKEQAIYESIHQNIHNININAFEKIKIDSSVWYNNYSIISHGGGGIDGKLYSESKEAMELSYSKGNRVFDIDISETADKRLVLCHGWDENVEQTTVPMSKSIVCYDNLGTIHYNLPKENRIIPKYNDFIQSKVYGLYHRQSFDDLLQFMEKYPDVYIAPDVPADRFVEMYKRMVQHIKSRGKQELLDRFIVRISDTTTVGKIKEIDCLKNYAYKCYDIENHNYYDVLNFMMKNSIPVIILPYKHVDDEGIKILLDKGIRIYFGVVDYLTDYEIAKNHGNSGIVSNFLYEDFCR